MLYLDSDNLDYKYVVSNSDNYIVLSKVRNVYGDYMDPDEITVLVQYLEPSDLSFETTQTFYQSRSFPQIDVSDSDWQRSDISNVLFISCILVILTIWIYDIISKIFVRGGFCR